MIAWSQNPGRPDALAETIGAVACTLYPQPFGSRNPLLRYAASALLTLAEILRRRPEVVVVQNPTVFPALIAWAWSAATGGRLILDSHPSAFGAKDNRQGRLMLPVSRWLSRRAEITLVTVQEYVDLLSSWGARGLIVHEPPVDIPVVPAERPGEGPVVFFATLFAEDEPVREVMEVAAGMPDTTFVLTGRVERCPVPEPERPANCVLPGFLPLDRFLALMASSDLVLSLTDDVTSVARSAYEATYLELPLVVSRVPSMVAHFPHAEPCGDSAESIADAVHRVLAVPPEPGRLREAHQRQLERWAHQCDGLLRACGETSV